MPITYDIESDIRYQQGLKAGLKQYRKQSANDYVTFLIINLLLKTDLSSKKIAQIVIVKMPLVAKWVKALTKYEVRKTWECFNIIKENERLIFERATATAKKLIKIDGLSDEIIGKICDLEKIRIAQIRKIEKRKMTKQKGEILTIHNLILCKHS